MFMKIIKLHKYHLHLFQIGVMTVTVLPIRVVMIALSLFVAWGIGKLILRGHDVSKPMRGWRRYELITMQSYIKTKLQYTHV